MRSSKTRTLWALLLMGPLLGARAEDGDAAAWLNRLNHSMNHLSYRGVLTYERGDHLESLRVTHGILPNGSGASGAGEEYERLEHLDGDRREVIRRGDQLTCIYLGQRLSRLFNRDQLLKGALAGLESYYELLTAGEGRVAGRRTMGIQVKPKDEYRFGYRLALDYETGLLLRSELVGPEGRVLERFQFVDLQIGPLRPEWVAEPQPAAGGQKPPGNALAAKAMVAAQSADEPASHWSAEWLPPGFVLALPARQTRDDVLTYSDGLAVMSVFIEASSEPMPAAEGRARQGATVAYTRPLRRNDQSYLVTVVGEVPQATAERVANSVDLSAR